MILTLLVDLDDTLLDTNLQAFLPAYFQALATHLSDLVRPDIMLPALMSGTQRMLENMDSTRTLQNVFEADFYPKVGVPKEELAQSIDEFYDNVFPGLGSLTKKREGADELVYWARSHGHRVAVATDPVFPLKAVLHRIQWAGLEPKSFDLISSYETFHFSKSHPAYFAEVLGRLGWPDGPVLMIGNDVNRDLNPAQHLGLATYHVDGTEASGFRSPFDRQGDLISLRAWLDAAEKSQLEPSFRSRDAILTILESTPAVLQSLTAGLSSGTWSTKFSPDDWAMVELICHLRDTEREVHRMQIEILQSETHPFVPRPDAAVWAKQRNYLNENGPQALKEFSFTRVKMLDVLKNLPRSMWSRKARHAIFGPTTFTEVVGFIADHDRCTSSKPGNRLESSNPHRIGFRLAVL